MADDIEALGKRIVQENRTVLDRLASEERGSRVTDDTEALAKRLEAEADASRLAQDGKSLGGVADILDDAAAKLRSLKTERDEAVNRLRPLGGDCALTNCDQCYACQKYGRLQAEARLPKLEDVAKAAQVFSDAFHAWSVEDLIVYARSGERADLEAPTRAQDALRATLAAVKEAKGD